MTILVLALDDLLVDSLPRYTSQEIEKSFPYYTSEEPEKFFSKMPTIAVVYDLWSPDWGDKPHTHFSSL